MNYWLVKSDPGSYSWGDLVKDKKTWWDGVRNYQARNFMVEMQPGDPVLVYHSQKTKDVVGIAKVTREARQDPATDDERWVAMEIEAVEPLKNPVTLEKIKSEPALAEIHLIKNSRLSVMPLSKEEFDKIMEMSG